MRVGETFAGSNVRVSYNAQSSMAYIEKINANSIFTPPDAHETVKCDCVRILLLDIQVMTRAKAYQMSA